jgi:hypothetical protein
MAPGPGDVFVVGVGSQYLVGRAGGERQPFESIGVRQERYDALVLACQTATGSQRIWLYPTGGATDCVDITRADVGESEEGGRS